MSTKIAKPERVAIIGASGTYGRGILARAEEIGVEAVVVTRSPHKFPDPKPTTTVVEAELHEEEKLKGAFAGCDGVISALGDDRKERPKTHNLPHVWRAMKAAGVTRYVGMGSGPMLMPGETPGTFQRTIHALLGVLKLFGIDMLEQNEWERDSLPRGRTAPTASPGCSPDRYGRPRRPSWEPACTGTSAARWTLRSTTTATSASTAWHPASGTGWRPT